MKGNSSIVRPNGALTEVVDAIWNWEISDGSAAKAVIPVALPSAYPILSLHYGMPMWSNRPVWSERKRAASHYRQIATGIQSGVVTFRPSGPSGCVVVRLKPEGAARLIGANIHDFANTNVVLEQIFGAGKMRLLVERLQEANNDLARIGFVEGFLLQHLRHDRPDVLACHAAASLRLNPSQRIHDLASQLDVSGRQLSRAFWTMFGISPKEFARVVRLGRLLVARRKRGLSWADAASFCGFADQAHMIRDFNALVGVTPQAFFRTASRDNGFNSSLAESHFYNQFFTR